MILRGEGTSWVWFQAFTVLKKLTLGLRIKKLLCLVVDDGVGLNLTFHPPDVLIF